MTDLRRSDERSGVEPDAWHYKDSRTLRALLAEGVAAQLVEARHPDEALHWKGGQTRGFDIAAGPKAGVDESPTRYDAKAVEVNAAGDVELTRWNAEPFDPDLVDFLVLVHLSNADMTCRVGLTQGHAAVHGEATIHAVWLLPTAELNELIEPARTGEGIFRKVILDRTVLDPFLQRFD